MSLIADIADFLEDAGVGTLSTDLFYSYMPADLNAGVCVIDTGGPQPNPDVPLKNPTFQIFVRAADYDTGKTKLEAVRTALHRVQNQTIGSYYFYYILASSEGGHIGRNEAGKDEFSINFETLTR